LPTPSSVLLEPRKTPVQARSTASVDAILEATIQVLLAIGKERLTTARVARRAGVSIGTLYQYFPNKSSLLQAVLRRHLDCVATAVEHVCQEQKGNALAEMATALIEAFLEAKIGDGHAGAALYAVSSDVDGANIAKQMSARINEAIVEMLTTACDPLKTDPSLAASILQGAIAGVSRRLLESDDPKQQRNSVQRELTILACSYLAASSAR
jgi:AcrR family transcriptional regulator